MKDWKWRIKKWISSRLLKPITTFITKIGGKVGTGLLKSFGRGIVKFISKIPVFGALLDFALNVFVFKENPGRAAFKAIGAALLGLIGTALGPIGTIIGGFAGDWAGGALYDFMIASFVCCFYAPVLCLCVCSVFAFRFHDLECEMQKRRKQQQKNTIFFLNRIPLYTNTGQCVTIYSIRFCFF